MQGGRVGERRASSPFQNGQTEVLIGEVEGGPRSPRGSTSSAVNDANFLGPPDERDGNKPICRRVTPKSSLFYSFIFVLTSKSSQHEFHRYSERVARVCASSFIIIIKSREKGDKIGEKTRESVAVPCNLYRVAPTRLCCLVDAVRTRQVTVRCRGERSSCEKSPLSRDTAKGRTRILFFFFFIFIRSLCANYSANEDNNESRDIDVEFKKRKEKSR